MSYLIWKLLHISSVIIFLGNIATGLFWAAHAHRTRDFRLIISTFQGIIRSDRWFTIPGVMGIIVSGVVLATKLKAPILGTGWILWPIGLFATSGIVFGVFVAPLQHRIADLTRSEFTEGTWSAYAIIYKKWELWGLIALLTPVAGFAMMVLKPVLPAL